MIYCVYARKTVKQKEIRNKSKSKWRGCRMIDYCEGRSVGGERKREKGTDRFGVLKLCLGRGQCSFWASLRYNLLLIGWWQI